MSVKSTRQLNEHELLDAARGATSSAFARLVEPHRGELHAHCYRMLGSLHDAEDALQDALLRAWRGLSGFEGRSSLRTWLYRIATNAACDASRAGRSACCRSTTARPPARTTAPGEPLAESVWIEPYPDESARRSRTATRRRRPLRAARERRARVRRRASAPAAAPARRPDPARGARLLGARGRRVARHHRRRRSTARSSAPGRRSTSGCPPGASRRRCARSATSGSASSSRPTSSLASGRRRRRRRDC